MAPKGKIVDRGEVKRWYEEGRTYRWMVQEYARKYNVQITVAAFSELRRQEGWTKRYVHNEDLIPWKVEERHRYKGPAAQLRSLANRRAGVEMDDRRNRQLDAFLAELEELNAVVHYDPETEDGFFYVPREEGDTDVVRRPRKTKTH